MKQAGKQAHLVAAGAEPAAGGEVEGALGAGGGVEQTKVAMAVDPGAAHDQVVGRAVGRHQAEHLARPPQLDPRTSCDEYSSHLSNVATSKSLVADLKVPSS